MTFSQTVSGNSTIDKFLLSKLLMKKQQEMTDILPFWGVFSVLLTVKPLFIITSSLVNIILCDDGATKINLMNTLN